MTTCSVLIHTDDFDTCPIGEVPLTVNVTWTLTLPSGFYTVTGADVSVSATANPNGQTVQGSWTVTGSTNSLFERACIPFSPVDSLSFGVVTVVVSYIDTQTGLPGSATDTCNF